MEKSTSKALNYDGVPSSKIDFEEICNHMIDAIYITDAEGTTLYVNDKYLELGNLKRDELIGKSVFEINEEEKIYSHGVIPQVLKTKKICETIGTLLRTKKKVHIIGIPIFDEMGKIKYAVAHEKDAERLEELKDNLAKLRQASVKDTAEIEYLRQQQIGDTEIVIASDNMKEAFATIYAIAATDVTVLITGQSGTGKEVLCDAIYRSSNRNNKPFIKINCSAIPANLLESELFGYEPGAFTGADRNGKTGLMEIAHKGILLLDEIGDMPLDLQAKMLRVLQSKEIIRIGGKDPIKLDIRILAATNKNLLEEIRKQNFREDLYYRLNVVPIHLKPLRERKEDLRILLDNFLQKYNFKYNKKVVMTSEALNLMMDYSWPGNIRELKNIIERMVVINKSNVIDFEMVSRVLGVNAPLPFSSIQANSLKSATEDLEKRMITTAIAKCGTKRKAAKALGVDHSTLIKKCQRYGI